MVNIAQILEQCGRTLESISKSTEISVARLREAQVDNSWNVSEITRIAKTLNVSLEDLLTEPVAGAHFAFQFRTNAEKTESCIPDYEVVKLNRYVNSALALLEDGAGRSWRTLIDNASDITAGALATKFREIFYPKNPIGPITDLPMLCAEQLGCLIYTINSGHMDGASAFIDGRPFVFVSRRFAARMLFTLAHELGHLFRKTDTSINSYFIDQDIFNYHGAEETFANSFASQVLMPEEGVLRTIKTYREKAGIKDAGLGDIEITVLGHLFGVSFEAAALRCEGLGLLPKGGSDALADRVRKAHGSAEKRLREEGLPERPRIEFPAVSPELLNSAIDKVRAGKISLGDAVGVLGIGARDLFPTAGPVS